MKYTKEITKEIRKIIQIIYGPSVIVNINNFEEQADWYQISIRPNLSNAFINKFFDYLYLDKILHYQQLSDKMREKIEGEIKIVVDKRK